MHRARRACGGEPGTGGTVRKLFPEKVFALSKNFKAGRDAGDAGAAPRGDKRVPPRKGKKKGNAEKTGRGQKKLRFATPFRCAPLSRCGSVTRRESKPPPPFPVPEPQREDR